MNQYAREDASVFDPSEDEPAQPSPYEGGDIVQEDFRDAEDD